MTSGGPSNKSGDRPKGQLDRVAGTPTEPMHAEAVLSSQLRAALMDALAPNQGDRVRVELGLSAALSARALPPALQRVDLAMASRAATIKAGGVLAPTLLTKFVASSLVLVGAAAVGVMIVPRPATPRTAPHTAHEVGALSPAPSADPSGPQPSTPAATARAADAALAQAPVVRKPETQPSPTVRPAHRRFEAARAPVQAHRRRSAPAAQQAQLSAAAPTGDASELSTLAPAGAPPPTQAATAAQPTPALAAELALVREASMAIERHEPGAALARLARYASRYPSGALRIEAQALRAIALCANRATTGPVARDLFVREHAGSALAERVERACAPTH